MEVPRPRWRAHARFAALLISLGALPALADGPHIAFHATQGVYTITLFSAPDPLVAGPVELTLLVQNAADGSGAAVSSAIGQLSLTDHAPLAFTLTPDASHQLLLRGTVSPPAPGEYRLSLRTGAVVFTGTLPVAANHSRRTAVIWASLLPGVIVMLFLINQHAKQLRRGSARNP